MTAAPLVSDRPHPAEPSATVLALLTTAAQRLTAAGCETPRLDAELLLAHTLKQDRSWLYRYPAQRLEPQQQRAFRAMVARRAEREPVAYLLGEKEFFGLTFAVDAHTLVPRPETELLVETALAWAGARLGPLLAADIGTGSGCLAVTLARHLPRSRWIATDLSVPALQMARHNAASHQSEAQITFLAGDLLEPLPEPVDLLVSNPPYLPQNSLQPPFTTPEIYQYEPRLALAGGANGLAVIERLLAQAPAKLKPGGILMVEIGFDQGPTVQELARRHFPHSRVRIEADLAGHDRLLIVE